MTNIQQQNPFRPLCCPLCGAYLGDIQLFKVKKRNNSGVVQYPWSLADTVEMEIIPEEHIHMHENKLRAACHCISIYSIPNF
jgi:hypothetical protein